MNSNTSQLIADAFNFYEDHWTGTQCNSKVTFFAANYEWPKNLFPHKTNQHSNDLKDLPKTAHSGISWNICSTILVLCLPKSNITNRFVKICMVIYLNNESSKHVMFPLHNPEDEDKIGWECWWWQVLLRASLCSSQQSMEIGPSKQESNPNICSLEKRYFSSIFSNHLHRKE